MLIGRADVIVIFAASFILALILYIVFHNAAYKNIYKRFKQYRRQRYGFYECGFRPKHDVVSAVPVYSYVMLCLIILYDVEICFLVFIITVFNALPLIGVLATLGYIASLIACFLVEVSNSAT